MPLDEIGQGIDPVEVYKSAYALFNGTGKLQGAEEGGNRELKRERTGEVITGWDAQTCRDVIQHSFNAWVREFGTGNKGYQQVIEQCEAFLNAYGMSRFAPLDYV